MKLLNELAKSDGEPGALGRHAVLLGSLVGLLVALPAFRAMPGGHVRYSILLCGVLLASVYVSSRVRWTLILAGLMGFAAIVAVIVTEVTGSPVVRIGSVGLGLGLLGFTTLLLLNSLMRAERVSDDTIIGGICAYMMIGLWFAMAYSLVLILDPSELVHGGEPLASGLEDSSVRSAQLLYFSFVTLTTLGFGDITPAGEVARMMVTAEAIIGQLYIAIFIARLMALYLAGDRFRIRAEALEQDGNED
jgi:hypothetical protein